MDLAENSRKAKPIMIGIGMGMAMSDGSLDVKKAMFLKIGSKSKSTLSQKAIRKSKNL